MLCLGQLFIKQANFLLGNCYSRYFLHGNISINTHNYDMKIGPSQHRDIHLYAKSN